MKVISYALSSWVEEDSTWEHCIRPRSQRCLLFEILRVIWVSLCVLGLVKGLICSLEWIVSKLFLSQSLLFLGEGLAYMTNFSLFRPLWVSLIKGLELLVNHWSASSWVMRSMMWLCFEFIFKLSWFTRCSWSHFQFLTSVEHILIYIVYYNTYFASQPMLVNFGLREALDVSLNLFIGFAFFFQFLNKLRNSISKSNFKRLWLSYTSSISQSFLIFHKVMGFIKQLISFYIMSLNFSSHMFGRGNSKLSEFIASNHHILNIRSFLLSLEIVLGRLLQLTCIVLFFGSYFSKMVSNLKLVFKPFCQALS